MFEEAHPLKYVRESVLADIPCIAMQLRSEDRRELETVDGCGVYEKLFKVLKDKHRQTFSMLSPSSGEPFGMFGLDYQGIIWMVSTPEIERHAITFLRESRKWISWFHIKQPLLWNWVDSRNPLHVKWLTKWLHFNITHSGMINDVLFYRVEHRRDDQCVIQSQ